MEQTDRDIRVSRLGSRISHDNRAYRFLLGLW